MTNYRYKVERDPHDGLWYADIQEQDEKGQREDVYYIRGHSTQSAAQVAVNYWIGVEESRQDVSWIYVAPDHG